MEKVKSKYRGVKFDNPGSRYKAQWKVQFKAGGRVMSIFRHENELACALVADFVRFLTYGTDLSKWPANGLKPNFAPSHLDGLDTEYITVKLIGCRAAPEAVILRHLEEYNAMAKKLRPRK